MSDATPTIRSTLSRLGRLIGIVRPYWGQVLKGIGLGVGVSLLGLISPLLTKLLVDEVYPSGDVSLLNVIVLGGVAIAVTSSVFGGLTSYYTTYVNVRMGHAVSVMFFNHLQHLPSRFFDTRRAGEMMARFRDVSQSLSSATASATTVFVQGTYLLVVPPVLFFIEWRLALVALISFPVTTLIIGVTGKPLRRRWKASAESEAELSALKYEALSHVRTLKSLGLERYFLSQAQTEAATATKTRLRAAGLGVSTSIVVGVVQAAGVALYTWVGWMFVLDETITLGDFLAFSAYVGYVSGPLGQFVGLFSSIQQVAVNLGRMFEYLDEEPEGDPASAFAPPGSVSHVVQGGYTFDHVGLSYGEHQVALRSASMVLPPGTTTSIVGPSGAGKTSVLRILSGVEKASAGRALLDGVPIEQIPPPDLRRQVAAVWQEFGLLRGTLWENLTVGLEEVPRSLVWEVAEVCELRRLIEDLPQGLDTPVGEWGATLSGGQRQRVALARAVLRRPSVLLLDEATSNIDPQAEASIFSALASWRPSQTMVFVTHRTQTARLADQVVVMEGGRVEAVGTHDDLVETSDLYRAMLGAAGHGEG